MMSPDLFVGSGREHGLRVVGRRGQRDRVQRVAGGLRDLIAGLDEAVLPLRVVVVHRQAAGCRRSRSSRCSTSCTRVNAVATSAAAAMVSTALVARLGAEDLPFHVHHLSVTDAGAERLRAKSAYPRFDIVTKAQASGSCQECGLFDNDPILAATSLVSLAIDGAMGTISGAPHPIADGLRGSAECRTTDRARSEHDHDVVERCGRPADGQGRRRPGRREPDDRLAHPRRRQERAPRGAGARARSRGDPRLPPQRECPQHPSRTVHPPDRCRDHQPRQPVLQQLRPRGRGDRRAVRLSDHARQHR